jgi:excisionase family DNA binding protein
VPAPHSLPLVSIGRVAEELGLSESRVRQLSDAGFIPFTRTAGGHRRFNLDQVRSRIVPLRAGLAPDDLSVRLGRPDWKESYLLAGLEEHVVWREVEAALNLRDDDSSAARIAQYAFDEMLNNAIEHSEGRTAAVRVWLSRTRLAFEVIDDGVGAFAKARQHWNLPDETSAILELSKGKRTTAPDGHSGEGIFFTSRAVDIFRIEANGLSWTVDQPLDDQAVGASRVSSGTRVACLIDHGSERTLSQVFEKYTRDFEFTRSRPRVKLAETGGYFVSRSEARRLTDGLERFDEVEIDFKGVDSVGQGFVDEVFRVWAVAHPSTSLVPVEMNPAVEFMVKRGLPKRD